MSDLIERLEEAASAEEICDKHSPEAVSSMREANARIRELEAELAKAHSALGQLVADDHRNLVTATKAERNAIEAATIERCAQEAEWFINIEKFTARAVAQRIRAIKPDSGDLP